MEFATCDGSERNSRMKDCQTSIIKFDQNLCSAEFDWRFLIRELCRVEIKSSLSRHSVSLLHVNCFLNVYAAPTHRTSSHTPKNWLVSNIASRFGKIELNPRKWINEITQNEMAYETFSITENVGIKNWKRFCMFKKGLKPKRTVFVPRRCQWLKTLQSLSVNSVLWLSHSAFRFDLVAFCLRDINNVSWNGYQ